MNQTMTDFIQQRINASSAAIDQLREQIPRIEQVVDAVGAVLRGGGTLLTAGNGGSAAQSLHLAEELVGRYEADRRPWPAVSLCADPTALTCIANDYGFDRIFSRQCEALLGKTDALLVLSTSGNSANLVEAIQVATDKGCRTIGLLGRDGGRCAPMCEYSVLIEGPDTAAIQEAHQVIIHMICAAMETP